MRTKYKAGDKVRLFGSYLNLNGVRRNEKFATVVNGKILHNRAGASVQVRMIDPADWAIDFDPQWGLDRMELVESVAPEQTPEQIEVAKKRLQQLVERSEDGNDSTTGNTDERQCGYTYVRQRRLACGAKVGRS